MRYIGMVLGGLLLTTGMWAQTPAQKLIKRLKAIASEIFLGQYNPSLKRIVWG